MFRYFKIFLIFACTGLFFCPGIARAEERGTQNGLLPEEIIPMDELKQKIDQKETFVLFDARAKKSFDEAHIQGARLPLTEDYYQKENLFKEGLIKELPDRQAVLKEAMTLIPKETPIITYCNTGCHASAVLALQLKQLGYTRVKAYEEGFQSWQQRGYPVDTAKAA